MKLIEKKVDLEHLELYSQHYFTKDDFKSIQTILNQSLSLKTLDLTSDLDSFTFLYIKSIFTEVKDNFSLEILNLYLENMDIEDFSFLKHFKSLTSLHLSEVSNGIDSLLQNISSKTLPLLNSVKFKYLPSKIMPELNFSNISIKDLDISSSEMNEETITKFFKGILSIDGLKSLNICKVGLNNFNENSVREFVKVLYEILTNSKKLEFIGLSFLKMGEMELQIILNGLEKNESIKIILLLEFNFGKLGKEFGKVLSKKNLEHLKFNDFSMKGPLSFIQYGSSIKSIQIDKGIKKDEVLLLSKFIQNNHDLENIGIWDIEGDLSLICQALQSHKKVKNFFIFNFYQLKEIGCIIEMIRESQSLESFTVNRLIIDNLKLIECLGESRKFKYFRIINSEKYKDLDFTDLIYNFDLQLFIGDIDSPFNDRNSSFIKNYYVPVPSFRDLFFKFN